jgi:Raf kinase inhibitor-like YbhB/YbcL family protein
MEELLVSSPVLEQGRNLPVRYASRGVAGGKNTSPGLRWSNPPPGTRSIALTVIDHHPIARNWLHWCVVNIPPETSGLQEGASRNVTLMPEGAEELTNSFGEVGYGGPQPPAGSGVHEYVFEISALSCDKLAIPRRAATEEIIRLLGQYTLARGSLSALFER